MATIINQIGRFVQRMLKRSSESEQKKEKIIKGLVKALDLTEDRELACEEVFEVIDHYAELVANGDSPEKVMPLVQHHLLLCGHCREEFEMLLDMLNIEIT
ncbi:MAG: hypothetical protein ACI9EW_001035 [Cellvibrionaceae bacterium]|jgi:hypothetical protein